MKCKNIIQNRVFTLNSSIKILPAKHLQQEIFRYICIGCFLSFRFKNKKPPENGKLVEKLHPQEGLCFLVLFSLILRIGLFKSDGNQNFTSSF